MPLSSAARAACDIRGAQLARVSASFTAIYLALDSGELAGAAEIKGAAPGVFRRLEILDSARIFGFLFLCLISHVTFHLFVVCVAVSAAPNSE
jgi:hypothetical protein